MIIVSGTMRVRPDAREAAEAAFVEMMEATRAEPGNRTYQFAFVAGDPALVRVYEEWDDQEAVDAHMVSPHMGTFGAKLGGLLAGSDGVDLHVVTESRKLV